MNTLDITAELKNALCISDRKERSYDLTQSMLDEARKFLKIIDVLKTYDLYSSQGGHAEKDIFTQPGLRYSQATALVSVILQNTDILKLSGFDRKVITDLILSDVKGQLLEDMIIYHTLAELSPKRYNVFKYQFENGEFDMVVVDNISIRTFVFEIKHSSEFMPESQCKHLVNQDYINKIAFDYFPICKRTVIYLGSSTVFNSVHYLNASQYLSDISGYFE